MEKNSVLDQLKALDEQRAKLLDGAKGEALEQAEKAVVELNELGFDYRLVEGPQTRSRRAAQTDGTGEVRRQQRDIPCPVCHFKTQPLHNGRAHRTQQPKMPFTAEELKERGLERVEGQPQSAVEQTAGSDRNVS